MKKLWILSLVGLISFQFSSSEAHDIPKQRYQIVFGRHVRADTFLLDTYTGRIWMPTKMTSLKGDPTIWVEQKIVGKEDFKKEKEEEQKEELLPEIQEELVSAYQTHKRKGTSLDPVWFWRSPRSSKAKDLYDQKLDRLAYAIAQREGITSDSGIRSIRRTLPSTDLEGREREKFFKTLFKKYNVPLGSTKKAKGSKEGSFDFEKYDADRMKRIRNET